MEGKSLRYLGSSDALRQSYQAVRDGLLSLAASPGSYFIDCSKVYDSETVTTFTDVWHFSDPAHRLLAEYLSKALEPILAKPQRMANASLETTPDQDEPWNVH